MGDLIKVPAVLVGYLVVGPALGLLLRGSAAGRHLVFALMMFMTSWHIDKLTLMLGSIEWYRGHVKGFEFSLIEILAISMLVGTYGGRRSPKPAIPPTLAAWLVYCGLSMLSLLAAENHSYVLMAGLKHFKAALLLVAAYAYFQRERMDGFRVLLASMSATLAIQAAVTLKMKYIDGFYQVRGWFEHQNPLAMWAYMLGLPLLAVAMGAGSRRQTLWTGAGFLSAAIIVQSSLSRAALAVFAVGTLGIALLSILEKPSLKRLATLGAMGVIGALGLAFTADTIISRFDDEGNEASGETREVMNLAAKAMLDDSAVGLGWNNFALTINHPYPYGDVIDDWNRDRGMRVDPNYSKGVVESHYWLLLAENGYPGLAGFLLFIGTVAWYQIRNALRLRKHAIGLFLMGLFCAFSLTYLHGNLERVLTQTKNLSAWLLLVGFVAAIEASRRNRLPWMENNRIAG